MTKKILIATLTFFIGIHTSFAFEDIKNTGTITRLLEKEVIKENDYFSPEEVCTRETFITWALKNIGEDVTGENIAEPFADVKRQDSARPFIGRAWQMGVIDTNILFKPKDPIAKIDALRIALYLEGVAIPRGGFTLTKEFDDIPKTAINKGVLWKSMDMRIARTESTTHFGTYDEMTRIECAKIIDAISLNRRAEQVIYDVNTSPDKPKEEIFDEVWDILKSEYLRSEGIDSEQMMEEAIKGTVNSLEDPYTVYFDDEETSNFLTGVGMVTQYGIGAQVGYNEEGQVIIVKPLKGSVSEEAGLRPGDIFIEVDGVNVSKGDMSLEEVVSLIKGKKGSIVEVKMQRGESFLNKKIVRSPIEMKSTFSRKWGDYLLIQIDFFGDDTVEIFRKAVKENESLAKNGIILDLRNNPGGFMDTATDLLGHLLPDGSIGVRTKSRDMGHKEYLKGPADMTEYPLVILVNEYSASASEIVAGAIQDYKRGAVLGQQTYGKGTAQQLMQFYDGSSLKVTFAEWLTPQARAIDGVGITPDYIFDTIEKDTESYDFAARIIRRGQWKMQ